MTIAELCPYLRFMDKRIYDTTWQEPVYAYDFRIFYIHEGEGAIDVDGVHHTVAAHSFCCIPPATPYRLSGKRLFLSILNFDLDNRAAGMRPRSSCPATHFDNSRLFSTATCAELAKPFVIDDLHEVEGTLYRMQKELDDDLPWATEHLSSLLRSLLILALRKTTNPRESITPLLREVLQYIEEHYTEPLTNQQIAATFHYHPYYLNKCFVATVGTPMHRYLLERRIRAAKQLLVQSSENIEEIAEQVGFLSHAHFTKMFREVVGMTPTTYRAAKRTEEI